MLVELNIDALVGPTHHYGGVGVGNVASASHARSTSHPRRAALEGLDKAAYVARLGVPQFLLPPPPRPADESSSRSLLSRLGFEGDFFQQCQAAMTEAPSLYSALFSSAFMWAANAGTFAPATDCSDGRNHLTIANLISSWHRACEGAERYQQFRDMFAAVQSQPGGATELHTAMPPLVPLRDEGAANHMRLCDATGTIGLHVFVYGESAEGPRPRRYLARQTLAACQAVARLHRLDPERTFFIQQHPAAIDAGVFHNDVMATSHENVLLYHQSAFIDAEDELERLEFMYRRLCSRPLVRIVISERDLTVADAVSSYLFNSQLLTPRQDVITATAGHSQPRMLLLCAADCSRMPHVGALIARLIADSSNPIEAAHFVSLDESMSGGGGPACLRLRLQLPHEVVAAFGSCYRLTPERESRLRQVIEAHYPDELDWTDLASPERLAEFAEAQAAVATAFS